MFCYRYKKLLVPYAEGALSEDARAKVEQHLARCEHCASELRAIESVSRVLRDAEVPAMEPAQDLWARVNAKIAAEPAPRRSVWGFRLASSAAAAVIVAVIGFGMMRPHESTSPQIAAVKPASSAAEKRVKQPESERVALVPSSPSASTDSVIEKTNPAPVKSQLNKPMKPVAKIKKPKPVQIAMLPQDMKHADSLSAMKLADNTSAPSINDSGKSVSEQSVRAMAYAKETPKTENDNPVVTEFADETDMSRKSEIPAEPMAAAAPLPSIAYKNTKSDIPSAMPDMKITAPSSDYSGGPFLSSKNVFGCTMPGLSPMIEKPQDSIVDTLNETEGVRMVALFSYP